VSRSGEEHFSAPAKIERAAPREGEERERDKIAWESEEDQGKELKSHAPSQVEDWKEDKGA
jgi:hypothetical protein